MTIPSTATCGGTECPAITDDFAVGLCVVPCCTADDACGTRFATATDPSNCSVPAVPDPNCPAIVGDALGTPIELPGCCAESGFCGGISTLSNTCITSSAVLTDLAPGDPCGNGGMGDGGMGDAGMGDGGLGDAGMDPIPGDSCPEVNGTATGGGSVTLPGCCSFSGRCGGVSSLSGDCITVSQFVPELQPGVACTP